MQNFFLKIVLFVIKQSSILGSILFNGLIINLFLFIKDANLAIFSDDNAINAEQIDINELIKLSEKEIKSAIDVFKNNDMIVNTDNFQAIILSGYKKDD